MSPIEEIHAFIESFAPIEHSREMEAAQAKAIGFHYYVSTLLSQAEADYAQAEMDATERLGSMDEETETLRKAKLKAWTKEAKLTRDNFKAMATALKKIDMALSIAQKNRREER